MNALKADPRTLDLRSLALHFYSLSERILELFEEEEMVDILSDVGVITPIVLLLGLTELVADADSVVDVQEARCRNR